MYSDYNVNTYFGVNNYGRELDNSSMYNEEIIIKNTSSHLKNY